MPVFALSLREPRDAHPTAPILEAEVGGASIVVMASAWGSWAGLEGEMPAARAALATLRREAKFAEANWERAMTRAFEAANAAIGAIPESDNVEGFPSDSMLIAVVADADSIWIGWAGSLIAARIRGQRVVQHTVAHTLRAQAEQDSSVGAIDLEQHPEFAHIITRTLQGSPRAESNPELARWDPLGPDERLLITSSGVFELVRDRLPNPELPDAAWLHAVLETDAGASDEQGRPRVRDRLGALVRR